MRSLPTSYNTLPWQKYVAIIDQIPSEKPEGITPAEWSRLVHIATLTVLLEVDEAYIDNLPAAEVFKLIEAIDFMNEPFVARKNDFKVKPAETLTYDEFVTYQKLRADQWNNLRDILLLVLIGVTPEQVDAMSIDDVMQVFFCLNKSIRKSLRALKYSTMKRAIWQTIKQLLNRSKPKSTASLKVVGGGLT